MAASCPLASERVWIDKHQYDAAECRFYESLNGVSPAAANASSNKPQGKIDGDAGSVEPKKKKNRNAKNKLKSAAETVTVEDEPKPVEDVKAKKKRSKKPKSQAEKVVNDEANVQLQKEKLVIDLASKIEQEPKTKEHKDKKNKADKKKGSNKSPPDIAATKGASAGNNCTLVSEIAKARQHIKDSLERMDGIAALAQTPGTELLDRLATVEKENAVLRETISKFENLVVDLTKRVSKLEGSGPSTSAPKPTAAAAAAPQTNDDDDDGVDLFASDEEEEDAAAAKLREERLAAYAAKKSKKPALIAKSNIILDVKCWDDETDMKALEAAVRSIKCDGLLWGASKLVALAYGIEKLQISCVVEDEKVSIDWLVDEIQTHEDFVQSVDIAAFNKI